MWNSLPPNVFKAKAFRIVRGDLIETYKIQTGIDGVDSDRMLPMVGESRNRGHSFRIRDKPFRTEVRRNLFSQRVVNVWNSLSPNVVEAKAFRIVRGDLIDTYKIQKGIEGVDSDRMLPMGVHN